VAARMVLLVILCALLLPGGARSQTGSPDAQAPGGRPPAASQPSDDLRRGIGHFNRAFYEHVPRKREREATAEFGLAVAAFERELALRPTSRAAHAYLARVYSVRKQFRTAASHYDKVMELDPLDVDACVLAALAYVEAGEPGEARQRLAIARTRTDDPAVLATLAEYAGKLDSLR
jgi:tetratricopeptide (TPR) repeat protein